jgi:hypothetical protein
VYGTDVAYNFPNPAECKKCGDELEKCTVADEAEVPR